MGGNVVRADNSRLKDSSRPRCESQMYQAYIVIFLLFFAVLAYGWFYWQRAKSRAAAGETTDAASTADAPATDAAASSDMATASSSTDQQ